ncbi:MAG TPA: metalloregulator ArsR/SmtB family transcription factor [Clostridia bacterium]|nr:metalloregulator ArsR/SmtB family transcription factor [Clostridia bacterium]
MELTDQEARELAEFYKIFGDPTRIRLIYLLSSGELNVGELAKKVNLSLSAISHQLRILKVHRIVKNRKEGTAVYYSLDDEHVYTLISQGYEHIGHR